jgi:hypothetical protein
MLSCIIITVIRLVSMTINITFSVTFKVDPPAGFVNYFLFSSCDTCNIGDSTNGDCTVDVSVVNNIADKNATRRICLSVGLKG